MFVHKGLLDRTPLNAVACVFLGFAETLGCLQTSFPIAGELLPPMSLNGIDMLVIFTWGTLVTFALSWVCDALIGKFVIGKHPSPEGASAQGPSTERGIIPPLISSNDLKGRIMLFGREQFAVKTEMGGEVIDKLYAKELVPTPIEEFEKLPEDEKKLRKPYPFNQRTYKAAPGIICDQDVAVPMRDGVVLYADIFRPADSTAKVPVILAWSNYGKRPNEYRPDELKAYTPGVPKGSISDLAKFEAADPEFWVPNGYAAANVDIRGIGYWADKIPDFSKVVVPAYVTAGWNHFHLQGSVNG